MTAARPSKWLRTPSLIAATVLITWFAKDTYDGVERVRERMWLISAVKVPLRMALAIIQEDLRQGNRDRALAALDALAAEASEFDEGTQALRGPGLGRILERLKDLDSSKAPPTEAPPD